MKQMIQSQREYFLDGKTMSYASRMHALTMLEQAIVRHKEDIYLTLKQDLHKSKMESHMTEVGMALSEVRDAKKHLKEWMKKDHRLSPIAQFPSKSFVMKEPYGVVLIMAPWNYPFLLLIQPLVGAIAAGNCAVLKPSEHAPATESICRQMIEEVFDPQYISVVTGGIEVNQQLLSERFDYIFFTGSPAVGKIVMEKAARYLTPVTLELGGKSPCIVDESADITLSAKRIVFGKYLNAGQTCVAPDYILVHESVKDVLIEKLIYWIQKWYTSDPLSYEDYPKIINQKQFDRLCGYLKEGTIVHGGSIHAEHQQIEPTLLTNVTMEDAVMQEEIFGPILPILTYENTEDIKQVVRSYEKPLALYLFTTDRDMERWVLENISFGGGCVNDTIVHLATPYMGFGGVGSSGMGSYHGKFSFDTFSHHKSIMKKANWLDIGLRYLPYTENKFKILNRFM